MTMVFNVLGLGTFGYQVAINLEQGGATVMAVDIDKEAIQRISNLVHKAVCADCGNEEVLKELNVEEADGVIVSLPDHFDTAVLATYYLSQAGVKQILVQVETEAQANAIKAVGATRVIFPEKDTAQRIARVLLMPDLAEQVPVSRDISIIELPCPEAWKGKSLKDLEIRKKHHVYVIGLKTASDGETHEAFDILPSPEDPLPEECQVVIIGKSDNLLKLKNSIE
jgi:trk system potassium uptake protein